MNQQSLSNDNEAQKNVSCVLKLQMINFHHHALKNGNIGNNFGIATMFLHFSTNIFVL
jgi:hypothetical protein